MNSHSRARDDTGSIPLAMLLAFFVLVMSSLALSSFAAQYERNQTEAATSQAAVALNSGAAEAAQTLYGTTAQACGIPTWTPDTYTTAPDGKGAYRWWADQTDIDNQKITMVVEANSGNRGGAFTGATTLNFTWDSARQRWVIDRRGGISAPPVVPRNLLAVNQATASSLGGNMFAINTGAVSVSTEQSSEGGTSFKLVTGATASSAIQIGNAANPTTVTAGQQYTFTFQAYTSAANVAVRPYALFYNDAGTQLSAAYFASARPIPAATWTAGQGSVTAPDNATKMVLRIYPVASGGYTAPALGEAIYYDRLAVAAGDIAPWSRPPAC